MIPIASPVPTVVTIHDMSLTLYPSYHPLRRVLLNRPFVNLAARRAAAIITVSQSAKRDIVRIYGLPAERVHVVHEAAALAHIDKRVSMHTLRHCFATHLLEQKEDIRVIQVLLGHKKLETTALYAQVATDILREVVSPIETLQPL